MIYDKIKALCEERGISVYFLEKELNFSRASISKWKTSSPSVKLLSQVAKYFDIPLEYFVE